MKRLAAEVLAQMLAGYGVTHVFMVPAVVRRTFVEMERRTQIKRIHCHGEKAAAYMADGYARASGKPGVCMAQVVGALNLAAGLRDAWLARSPIIAITGGRDPKTKFRGVYQEVDDMPSFELVSFADALHIPVATSLNGKDSIPGAHPLSAGVVGTYSREAANRVVARADFVLFTGTSAGGMTTHFWAVPKIGLPAAQIDIDPEALGRNYPLKVAIVADAKRALGRLTKLAQEHTRKDRSKWIAEGDAIRKAYYEKYKPQLESNAVPIHPGRICSELSKHVPEDAIVVVDTGHAGMWMGGMFDLRSLKQSYMRSAGHLGWAFPAGLGAKAACPDRPVITFTGDASFWYHIGQLETAVRWKLNAITLVNNNSSGNQSKRGFDRVYGGQ